MRVLRYICCGFKPKEVRNDDERIGVLFAAGVKEEEEMRPNGSTMSDDKNNIAESDCVKNLINEMDKERERLLAKNKDDGFENYNILITNSITDSEKCENSTNINYSHLYEQTSEPLSASKSLPPFCEEDPNASLGDTFMKSTEFSIMSESSSRRKMFASQDGLLEKLTDEVVASFVTPGSPLGEDCSIFEEPHSHQRTKEVDTSLILDPFDEAAADDSQQQEDEDCEEIINTENAEPLSDDTINNSSYDVYIKLNFWVEHCDRVIIDFDILASSEEKEQAKDGQEEEGSCSPPVAFGTLERFDMPEVDDLSYIKFELVSDECSNHDLNTLFYEATSPRFEAENSDSVSESQSLPRPFSATPKIPRERRFNEIVGSGSIERCNSTPINGRMSGAASVDNESFYSAFGEGSEAPEGILDSESEFRTATSFTEVLRRQDSHRSDSVKAGAASEAEGSECEKANNVVNIRSVAEVLISSIRPALMIPYNIPTRNQQIISDIQPHIPSSSNRGIVVSKLEKRPEDTGDMRQPNEMSANREKKKKNNRNRNRRSKSRGKGRGGRR